MHFSEHNREKADFEVFLILAARGPHLDPPESARHHGLSFLFVISNNYSTDRARSDHGLPQNMQPTKTCSRLSATRTSANGLALTELKKELATSDNAADLADLATRRISTTSSYRWFHEPMNSTPREKTSRPLRHLATIDRARRLQARQVDERAPETEQPAPPHSDEPGRYWCTSSTGPIPRRASCSAPWRRAARSACRRGARSATQQRADRNWG